MNTEARRLPVSIVLNLTADQVLVLDMIVVSNQVNLLQSEGPLFKAWLNLFYYCSVFKWTFVVYYISQFRSEK